MRRRVAACLISIIAALSFFAFTVPARAGNNIVLDGKFGDWEDQPFITDPAGDAGANGDIIRFAWTAGEDDGNLYFMLERRGWGENPDLFPVTYKIFFDINDNGKYDNGCDSYAYITYLPFMQGRVAVSVFSANNRLLESYSGNWGEARQGGGRKCEFCIKKNTIKVQPGHSMRMYVQSYNNDRCPDYGDIQWSSIPLLPWWGLGVIFVLALTGLCLQLKKGKPEKL